MALTESSRIVGFSDPTFSAVHKVRFQQTYKGVVTTVVGLIGEGATMTEQANWESPFEGDNVGSIFQTAGGIFQNFTEDTFVTKFNSTQVWQGSNPITFDIPVRFIALANPEKEVMAPIAALSEMQAADFAFTEGIKGRIPPDISVSIGERIIYAECRIENISKPLDFERDENGAFLRQEISVSIQTKTSLGRSDVKGVYRQI